MSKSAKLFYEFGEFRVDVGERLLFREGTALPLPPKAFDILLALVQQSGHLLGKRELIETVWPDSFIEENNLTQYISALRKALGDDRHEQRYIETVSRRGYRFLAPVTQVQGEGPSLIVENRTRVRVVVKEEKEERDEEVTVLIDKADFWTLMLWFRRHLLATYALLALTVIIAGAGLYWLQTKFRQSQIVAFPKIDIHSLAVLPFRSASAGDNDQYLGLAMAHDLSARLSRNGLHTLPVSASYRYLDDQGDPVRAGRELAVDVVVFGTLKKSGRRIAINAQLVRVSDGVPLWARNFEDDSGNLFALQNTIAAAVGEATSPNDNIRGLESIPRPGTLNLDAYEANESGWFQLSRRTSEAIHLSVVSFERATTQDPDYALAYAGLAEAYSFDIENWNKAELTAARALEIDKNLSEAHATIGFVRMFWMWDWAFAEKEFKRALALNPDYATAHQWYAFCLAAQGRLLDAKEEMRRALDLDPFSLPINADMGQMLYFSQQYDEAIDQCRRAIAMDPEFLNAHIYLSEAYAQKGMSDKAFAEYFNVQKLAGGNILYSPAAEESLRKAYDESGIKGFWRARLRFLEKRSHDPFVLAEFCARLGDNERALNLLEQAYRQHNTGLAFINVNPVFSDFRNNARFEWLSDRIFPKSEKNDQRTSKRM